MSDDKQINSPIKKIKWWFNFISTIIMNSVIVILVIIIILIVSYALDVLFKNKDGGEWVAPLYGAYVIVSPSMEPIIHVQDAILIKRTDEPKIGDVCTYLSKDPRWLGIKITHRIIGIDVDEDGNRVYIFKGDANNVADSLPVAKNQIYGKVIMRIPKIGYIQYFLSQAYGWIIAIVIPCVGIITLDVIKLVKNTRQKRQLKKGGYNEK